MFWLLAKCLCSTLLTSIQLLYTVKKLILYVITCTVEIGIDYFDKALSYFLSVVASVPLEYHSDNWIPFIVSSRTVISHIWHCQCDDCQKAQWIWAICFFRCILRSPGLCFWMGTRSLNLDWAPGLLPCALAETGAQHGRLALMLPSSPASHGPHQNR